MIGLAPANKVAAIFFASTKFFVGAWTHAPE